MLHTLVFADWSRSRLPDLTLSKIMLMVGYESIRDLHNCRQVCKRWNGIIVKCIWGNPFKKALIENERESRWKDPPPYTKRIKTLELGSRIEAVAGKYMVLSRKNEDDFYVFVYHDFQEVFKMRFNCCIPRYLLTESILALISVDHDQKQLEVYDLRSHSKVLYQDLQKQEKGKSFNSIFCDGQHILLAYQNRKFGNREIVNFHLIQVFDQDSYMFNRYVMPQDFKATSVISFHSYHILVAIEIGDEKRIAGLFIDGSNNSLSKMFEVNLLDHIQGRLHPRPYIIADGFFVATHDLVILQYAKVPEVAPDALEDPHYGDHLICIDVSKRNSKHLNDRQALDHDFRLLGRFKITYNGDQLVVSMSRTDFLRQQETKVYFLKYLKQWMQTSDAQTPLANIQTFFPRVKLADWVIHDDPITVANRTSVKRYRTFDNLSDSKLECDEFNVD